MASVETWIVNLIGAVSVGVGAYLAVRYVLPLVGNVLNDVLKYSKGVKSFVKLLEILIYVTAATSIIERITAIGEQATSYVSLGLPALEILNGVFFPTIRLLVIGVGILLVVERIKLK